MPRQGTQPALARAAPPSTGAPLQQGLRLSDAACFRGAQLLRPYAAVAALNAYARQAVCCRPPNVSGFAAAESAVPFAAAGSCTGSRRGCSRTKSGHTCVTRPVAWCAPGCLHQYALYHHSALPWRGGMHQRPSLAGVKPGNPCCWARQPVKHMVLCRVQFTCVAVVL